MIASATTAVTPVHAGTPVLNGRTKAEAFHSGEGKMSSGSCCGNSTEEEDALMEQEEERLMLEDEAEQHMLSVALAHSVEDTKGDGSGEVRSKDQVSSETSHGQVTGDSARRLSKSNGEGSYGRSSLVRREQVKTTGPERCGESKGESKGMDVHTEAPIHAPTAAPTGVPSPRSPWQRRTRKPLGRGATTEEGKSGGGVWLGTRKRRRELAMKTEPSVEDSSKERPRVHGDLSNKLDPRQGDGKSDHNPKLLGHATQLPPHKKKGQALRPKPNATKLESNIQTVSALSLGTVNNPVASPKSVVPAPKGMSSNSSSAGSSGAVPDPISSGNLSTKASNQNKEDTPTSLTSANVPAPILPTSESVIDPSAAAATGVDNNAAMQPPAAPPRRRIFSVDLDPAGFDFESSMGVTWSSPACIPAPSTSENLPPIVPPSGPNDGTGTLASTAPNVSSAAPTVHPSSAAAGRDRGMSFELFSLGVNVEEPLPPAPSTTGRVDAPLNPSAGRPRGDSIIFDPISFSDGGIHEESALQRTRNTSLSMEETDELEIMNSPGFVEAPASCLKQTPSMRQQQLPPAPPLSAKAPLSGKLPVPSPLLRTDTSVPSPLAQVPSNPVSHPPHNPLPVPVPVQNSFNTGSKSASRRVVPKLSVTAPQKETHRQAGKKVTAPLLPVSSSASSAAVPVTSANASAPPSDDKVINMPHGSAAAAAAAMAVPSTVVPSSLNGTATSHTACPMELLNKGGRIGIYLPEARKARIAKFHSKRKMRIWRKRIKYDCRKKLADSRPRIKGRFVKRSDMDDEE